MSSAEPAETKGWWTSSCIIQRRLDGKLAIVTGSNTGIGEVTAAELARRGCTVIMACRNMERAQAAKDRILSKYGVDNPQSVHMDVADESVVPSLSPVKPEQLILEQLDLGSLANIREFAKRVQSAHPKLDYLVHNAGLALHNRETTEDGFETTIGVNHLGPVLLTHLLLPAMKRAAPSRIVIVASVVHVWGDIHRPDMQIPQSQYTLGKAYNQSKLVNVIFARALAKRLEGTGITVVSLHPGMIDSDFFRDFQSLKDRLKIMFIKPFQINTFMGAQTTLYTILKESVSNGGYYANCTLKSPSKTASNDANREWVWSKSCELLGIDENKFGQLEGEN